MTELGGFNPYNRNNMRVAITYLRNGGKTNNGLKEELKKNNLKCGNDKLTNLLNIAKVEMEHELS